MNPESSHHDNIALPHYSMEEIAVIKKYYTINKKYREELNAELQLRLKDHPVFGPMMKAMTPEMRNAQQERSDKLQYAAIYEGKWEEYANDLLAQGRMYARMNISYTDWYELISMAKNMIMPLIRRDFRDNIDEGLDYITGLNMFTDYAMYGIAEAYFQEKNDIIRANEEKFAIIFKNSGDHIALVGKDGKIIMVNHVDGGGDPSTVVGRHIVDFQGVQNASTIEHAIEVAIRSKTPDNFDTEIVRGDSTRYYRSSVSPVIDENGAVSGAVIIARDVTDQKIAELELYNLNMTLENKVQERTEELRLLNKELESFTYSVSHDLRSPLRAINGFSEILKMECGDTLNEDAKDALREILKNTRKMGKLIDNLLEFSRLGKQHVSRADVDMKELVYSVIEDIRSASDKHVVFEVGELHHTNGDRSMLKQVVVNLISNAVKYSSKKPDPHIEIGSTRKNGEVTYFVKDNGAGFNMKYYNKLFGIFQRLHGSDEFEGIGVGLAIVQRVVSRHHGKVWAEGEEEKGATFYFSLPVKEFTNP